MPFNWFRIALVNFFVAAVMGLVLRYAFVSEISWLQYRPFQHGHSHVAMLGWLYIGLVALLIHQFVPDHRKTHFYSNNLILTQISVLGMFLTFPLQGYAPWSIGFATLHGLLSYAFAWRFIKDLRPNRSLAARWVRSAIFFMILSTLALWAMPLIILNGFQGKALYYAAIQFYLHFQFNGWFIFAALALSFHWMGKQGIELPIGPLRRFFGLLVLSCLLTYALAVTWSNPSIWLFLTNSVGVLLQFVALLYFLIALRKIWPELKPSISDWAGLLLIVALFSFTVKILIQTAVVFPVIATVAYTIRNFVVGFIHLILLGVMTPLLLGMAGKLGIIRFERTSAKLSVILFLLAFAGTEALLFLQGTMIWASLGFIPMYYELIFGLSTLFVAAVLLLLFSITKGTQLTKQKGIPIK